MSALTEETKTSIRRVEDLNGLPKGKLIRIAGQHDNGVEFLKTGRVYRPYNGTIELINHSKNSRTIEIEWILFDVSRKEIVIKDYKEIDYPEHIDSQLYQKFLSEWRQVA